MIANRWFSATPYAGSMSSIETSQSVVALPFRVLVCCLLLGLVGGVSFAGSWEDFIAKAGQLQGRDGERAARFLAEHKPPRDSALSSELLLENLDYAMRARSEFAWAREVPEDVFLNDVLPYASLDETRERWRPTMYARARSIVAGEITAEGAIQALNRELFNEINVHYNTGRKRPNQSVNESIAQGRATCTGLSIILVNACRAVGIPARVAGVANWHDERGNHTWVEIWDGRRWRFTGADEYNSNGLDRGWFVGDASKARAGDPIFGVWATSWKPAGGHFTMVWNRGDRSVNAIDSTELYEREEASGPSGPVRATRLIRVLNHRGERMVCNLALANRLGRVIAEDVTRAGRADLNDMPELSFRTGRWYTLHVEHEGETRLVGLHSDEPDRAVLDLRWDDLGLSKQTAEALIERLAEERAAQIIKERTAEIEARAFTIGDHTLRYKERVFGEPGPSGHSLWISMHGGGGTTPEVNDRQWDNQIRLYEPDEGIYIAPRAPTNTWNLWHQPHVDGLFDRLIETLVAQGRVDPNRVYLLGYSAGGDGVYQLAPRMADRFAAASMMAGHPNESKPLGLRNLPFGLFMGGDDSAYNRNEVARQWGRRLAELHEQDPGGYEHFVKIYEGLGHWMDGRDAEALPWMAGFTRDPWPKTVVWRQDDVTHTRFYWLQVDRDEAKAGSVVRASVNGQRIDVESEDVQAVTLRLRDDLVNLDHAIEVFANGAPAFQGVVPRDTQAIQRADRRSDAESSDVATIRISFTASIED